MNSKGFFTGLLLVVSFQVAAQNTIGLISYEKTLSYEGYNLLYPHNQSSVYLINNCGEIVNSWEDGDFVPGNSVYLTTEGTLVKCKRRTTSAINDPIWAGGGGETVEILTWDNELINAYELNDSLRRLHHDVAVMPNGNILMIAWELKTLQESINAGRDPDKIAQDQLWPEIILEWDPKIDSIIWEWHTWDHLIQDFDASKDNFGVVEDHPELVDLNYDEHDGHPDWLHSNAIDYNATLDQIVLSIPNFNEIWIIDHSTTSVEAATHNGGKYGKGGDLLYRWGNPQAYGKGNISDQKLFFQHDVHWAQPEAQPGDDQFNKIVLYNNRVEDLLSTVNTIVLPWDSMTSSYESNGEKFGPEEFEMTITHPLNKVQASSNGLSSAQLLPNDNFLICSGRWGYSYEVTPNQEIVWEYITPIIRGSRAEQGDTSLSIGVNLTFRVKRYGLDFEGLSNKDLTPKGYIELNADTTFCNNVTVSVDEVLARSMRCFPNPAESTITIESDYGGIGALRIFDISGREVYRNAAKSNNLDISINKWQKGIYFIHSAEFGVLKFVKL